MGLGSMYYMPFNLVGVSFCYYFMLCYCGDRLVFKEISIFLEGGR